MRKVLPSSSVGSGAGLYPMRIASGDPGGENNWDGDMTARRSSDSGCRICIDVDAVAVGLCMGRDDTGC